MANLTIRKLDDAIRDELRLRAARSGRSVEDEVRVILREAARSGASIGEDSLKHGLTSPRVRGEVEAERSEASGEGACRVNDTPPHPATPAAQTRRTGRHPLPASGEREKRITLIIGGGIAAYKALDLIRRLKERGSEVRVVLTKAAQQFVTALAASALAHSRVYTDLFDPQSEFDAGHIRLARDSDLIVVAPATADLMAKMAHGHADDLASAILLATNRPILLAPAMNPLMWSNAATTRNVAQLVRDGVTLIGPMSGEMAERNEAGLGRMAEPVQIAEAADRFLRPPIKQILKGRRVLITAGPTHEPIDPVRYIANRSSGKQGYAIAAAARAAGAEVTLVSGPVDLPDPSGVSVIRVESARDMLSAVEAALPCDVAIFAAAVADWRVAHEGTQKIKKTGGAIQPLTLVENPDILAIISQRAVQRPRLVIGFAAETENLIANATAKIARKGCDWIVANDVSPATGIMGGDRNTVHLLMRDGGDSDGQSESWPDMSKHDVAQALVARIATFLEST